MVLITFEAFISIVSLPFFSATQFLFLYISWDPDNITVSNNEKKFQEDFCMSEIAIFLDSIRVRAYVKTVISNLFCLL